ncbi:MAG: hypothetical protein ABIN91_08360 [Mucilaginibacter sp.]|uniref:hypothetical protein n=1 Tax=Mucilaginibacter sp. TaxID=1882438 RepID=UPI003264D351
MPITTPLSAASDLVTFTILINGQPIDQSYQVLSLVSVQTVNKNSYAKIEILDGSASDQTFSISESAYFAPGNTINISAGYQSTETSIFSGIVAKQSLQITPVHGSLLIVECYGDAIEPTESTEPQLLIAYGDSIQTLDIVLDGSNTPAAITGKVSFLGNALKAGATIQLAGLGDRFNGNRYISSVTQTIQNGDWITGAEFV